MRKRIPLFITFLAISSVAGLKSVAASPDCDKWLKQYQDELANAAPVKKVVHHVRHLVHRTQPKKPVLAHYIPPVHKPVVPKLTPAEMLKRFHVLCDTPEDEVELQPAMTDGFLPVLVVAPPPTEIATGIVPPLPGMPVMTSQPVPPVTPILPPPPVGAPGLPIIPITPNVPITPGQPGGPTPIVPIQPGQPITPGTPATPPVPEPSSLVLMLTGAAGIGTRLFRRKK